MATTFCTAAQGWEGGGHLESDLRKHKVKKLPKRKQLQDFNGHRMTGTVHLRLETPSLEHLAERFREVQRRLGSLGVVKRL